MVATKERRKSGGITLSAGELKSALAAVSPAVPSRAARPVLTNVRLGDGLVTGTDLEVRIDVAIDYHGDAMLLPHSRLLAILNAAGGDEVTLEPKGTSCVVRCGHGTWTLPVEDAAEFPLGARGREGRRGQPRGHGWPPVVLVRDGTRPGGR
jgi:DNA polymerase III sliding clamp (beta) subunit (PCNA family)